MARGKNTTSELNERGTRQHVLKSGNANASTRTTVDDEYVAPPEDLPVLHEKTIYAPAIVPPGYEEVWEPMQLACTTVNVAERKAHNDMKQMKALSGVLTPEECRAWVEWVEKQDWEDVKQARTAGYAFRDNGRVIHIDQEIAEYIFLRVKHFLPKTLVLSDGIEQEPKGCAADLRLYRYSKGQWFGRHIDVSLQDKPSGLWSQFTLLIYLNGSKLDEESQSADIANKAGVTPDEALRGGETNFYTGEMGTPQHLCFSFPPRMGWCLLHGCGERCLLHEGAMVREGTKYVLRTDVLYGPVSL